MVSSSCTTLSGGSPPSRCDRFIEPRVSSTRKPSRLRRRDLDVDGVFEAGGKHVMMVGRRGAAGQHQFGHRHRHAEIERLRRQPRPDRIKRLQPGKQFAVERRGNRARQRLIEMMMGVDQARQHHMLAGVEGLHVGRRRRRARRHQFDDAAVLHHDAALGASAKMASGSLIQSARRSLLVILTVLLNDSVRLNGRCSGFFILGNGPLQFRHFQRFDQNSFRLFDRPVQIFFSRHSLNDWSVLTKFV